MQADYILRIGERHIFEVGAKGILRQVNSDLSYLSAEGTGEFFVDPSRGLRPPLRYPVDSLEGTLLTTYANIGKEQALGVNAFVNIYLTNTWTVNGGIDLDYAFLEGRVVNAEGIFVTAKNSGLNYGGRLMSQLKLDGGWSAQAFTFMRGGFGIYAIGLSKVFNEGRGTIGLSAENFASRGWTLR